MRAKGGLRRQAWRRAPRRVAALLLATAPFGTALCLAQVRVEIRPSSTITLNGGTQTIAIDIDLGTSGRLLGSYGAMLRWDPTVIEYVGDSGGGQPPFDSAVVNRGDVGSGILRFSDASATGAAGRINVLSVTFRGIAQPPASTTLDLELTSIFASGTYEDIQPMTQVRDGTTCVSDFLFNLRVSGTISTFLDWTAVPGAVSYDVIRGALGGFLDDGTAVRLGTVICLENDSLDTTTAAGTEGSNPDTQTPPLGGGFFYLLRFNDGVANRTYGFPVLCARERVADSGDCP